MDDVMQTNHRATTESTKRTQPFSPNSYDKRANKQQKNDPQSYQTSSPLIVLKQSKLRDDKTKKMNSKLVNQIIERDLQDNSVKNCVLTKDDNLLIFVKSKDINNELLNEKLKFDDCEIIEFESSIKTKKNRHAKQL
jgi:hypothetical protein